MLRIKNMGLINRLLREGLFKEIKLESIDIDSFPDDIKKTLEEYRKFYVPKFDWNKKQDELDKSSKDFSKWLRDYENRGLIENIDKVITKVREDLITIKRKKLAEKKLNYFEELIKPSLGDEALSQPLSKFGEIMLMGNHSIEDIEKGFEEAKNIFDEHGNIDSNKITQSEVFVGGDINIPGFERFVNKNPEYKGVFEDWKKLHDEYMRYLLKELNAFRNSVPYNSIKKLYNFLNKLIGSKEL